jgi:transposase
MSNTAKTKSLSFEGQTFFVGIDTHKTNWKVTIRCNSIRLKEFSMDPNPKKLADYMHRQYPGGCYYSVYEAGFCGFWIHRELSELGFRSIIVNAADVPTSDKEKDRKTDVIDSGKLSRELESHSLRPIYVPDELFESLRSLSRLYQQFSRRATQIKNRIKSFLNFTGINIPPGYANADWSNNYLKMLKNLKFTQEANRFTLDTHLTELSYLRNQRKAVLQRIRSISKDNPTIVLLRSVPGIGRIIAFVLYVELVDIKRFKNLDHLLSFIGLVPSIYSSDEKMIVRGLSRRHSPHLRHLLVEAAWMAIRVDPALTAAFNELTKSMKKQKAVLRIAKKLAARIRYVWLNQKPYVMAVVE